MSLSYYKLAVILDADAGGQNGAPNQAVAIYKADGVTLATIYSDEAGTNPIAQPGATTDAEGNFEFYAFAGIYKAVSGGQESIIVLGEPPSIQGVSNYNQIGGSSTGPLGVIGGAVRVGVQPKGADNTFALVDDSQHDPINCTGVSGDLQTITVTHDQPQSSQVVGSCIVAPDETLAQLGIWAGGSINTENSVVTMAKRHQVKLNWTAAATTASDLIDDPFMDDTRYVITDNLAVDGSFEVIAPRTQDGERVITPVNRSSPDAYIRWVSDTTFDVFPYKNIEIACDYNGSAWTVSGVTSAETTALSTVGVSCSSSGNIITITHPQTLGTTARAIAQHVSTAAYLNASIYSESATQTQIVLLNSSNTPTAPQNGDRLNVRLSAIQWMYGESIVDLGVVKLSPTLDFKDVSGGNNFWLLGAHWATK